MNKNFEEVNEKLCEENTGLIQKAKVSERRLRDYDIREPYLKKP